MRKQYPLAHHIRRKCWAHPPPAYSTPAPTAAHAAPLDRASKMETTAAALPALSTCTTTDRQAAVNIAPQAHTQRTPQSRLLFKYFAPTVNLLDQEQTQEEVFNQATL